MNLRISGWCRLSCMGVLCIASLMAGCAGTSPNRTDALTSRTGNVQNGKAWRSTVEKHGLTGVEQRPAEAGINDIS